jgi:hypothetical protein
MPVRRSRYERPISGSFGLPTGRVSARRHEPQGVTRAERPNCGALGSVLGYLRLPFLPQWTLGISDLLSSVLEVGDSYLRLPFRRQLILGISFLLS